MRYLRRRRMRRMAGPGSGLPIRLAVMLCFVSVLRLMSVLGVGSMLDGALMALGSDGRFVSGALEAQAGPIPGLYERVLASAGGEAAAALAAQKAETARTEEDPALPVAGEEALASPSPETETAEAAAVSASPAEKTTYEAASPEGETAEPMAMEAPAYPSPETEASSQPSFEEADARAIEYTNATSYTPDTLALLQEPLELDLGGQGPKVLIVHTHTCEAYLPQEPHEYESSGSYRTTDEEYNVVRVGDELERALTENGIEVIHDTTINDYPSYTGSYTRTLEVIEGNLEKYPSIQIVIDLHRDAGITEDGEAVATYYESGDTRTSQVMLVVGTDEGGLPHSEWRENLKLALRLQALANQSCPGLMRPINLRQERFNQHATTGSLIVEAGFAGNTLQEAMDAINLFAKALSGLIASENLHT